jgi:hypothetical protein
MTCSAVITWSFAIGSPNFYFVILTRIYPAETKEKSTNYQKNFINTRIILIKDCYYYQRKHQRCKEKGRYFTAEIKKIVERYLISFIHSDFTTKKAGYISAGQSKRKPSANIRKGHFAMKRPVPLILHQC